MPNSKPSSNGASNGYTSKYAKLAHLLAYHERVVSAIKTTIELLSADDDAGAHARHSRTLRTAIVLDSIRTGSDRPAPKPRKHSGKFIKTAVKARRAASAALLATFDRKKPRPLQGTRGGILIQHGYLAKSGDGYVRTKKEFVV